MRKDEGLRTVRVVETTLCFLNCVKRVEYMATPNFNGVAIRFLIFQ